MEYVFETENNAALRKLPPDKRLKKINPAVLSLPIVSACVGFLFCTAYTVYSALADDLLWTIVNACFGLLYLVLLIMNITFLVIMNKRKPEIKTGTTTRATFTDDYVYVESFNCGVKYSEDKFGYGLIKQVRENEEYFYLMLSDTAMYPVKKTAGDGFKEFLNDRIKNAPPFTIDPAPELDENEVIFKNSTKLDKKALEALNGYCYRENKIFATRYVRTFFTAVLFALMFLLVGSLRLLTDKSYIFGAVGLFLFVVVTAYTIAVGNLSKKRSAEAAFGVPITVYLTVTTEGLKTRGFIDNTEIGRDEISYKDIKKVVDWSGYYFVFINETDAYVFDKNNFIVGSQSIFTEFFAMKNIKTEKGIFNNGRRA